MFNYAMPNFNMNYGFTPFLPFGGGLSSSSSSTSDTYESYLKDIEKENKTKREENAKLEKNILFNQEKINTISELQGKINEIDTSLDKIKKEY